MSDSKILHRHIFKNNFEYEFQQSLCEYSHSSITLSANWDEKITPVCGEELLFRLKMNWNNSYKSIWFTSWLTWTYAWSKFSVSTESHKGKRVQIYFKKNVRLRILKCSYPVLQCKFSLHLKKVSLTTADTRSLHTVYYKLTVFK